MNESNNLIKVWIKKLVDEIIEKLWILLPVLVILFLIWYFLIRDRQDEFGSL